MRLDEAVRGLSTLKDDIDEFDDECGEVEFTDTGDAWKLLYATRDRITDLLDSWDNG